ncbi:hypothetical protein C8J57DRAFT_1245019 [Mycena rebaudengoi]|nr:hypothetical protein C8J57DRAFT_1245019 [Mycena rebaudengoi]
MYLVPRSQYFCEAVEAGVVMYFFLPLHHHLFTSSIAAVSRTLGQHVCTEAALRRWCSSDEELTSSPSPTKTGLINGADAGRFTGLRRIVSTLLMDTKDLKGAGQETCCVRAAATPTPERRGLGYELEVEDTSDELAPLKLGSDEVGGGSSSPNPAE